MMAIAIGQPSDIGALARGQLEAGTAATASDTTSTKRLSAVPAGIRQCTSALMSRASPAVICFSKGDAVLWFRHLCYQSRLDAARRHAVAMDLQERPKG